MSKKRPYYKRFSNDFLFRTIPLSLEEIGALSICMDLIHAHDGPVDANEKYFAGNCRVSTRKWRALKASLINQGYLTEVEGAIDCGFLDREMSRG